MDSEPKRHPWTTGSLNEPAILGEPKCSEKHRTLSAAALRRIAMDAGEEALQLAKQGNLAAEHTVRCPACGYVFVVSYCIMARIEWPDEYELICGDCVRNLDLETLRSGSRKKQSTCSYVEKMLALGYTEEQLIRAKIIKPMK
jgi:hypothetical protein